MSKNEIPELDMLNADLTDMINKRSKDGIIITHETTIEESLDSERDQNFFSENEVIGKEALNPDKARVRAAMVYFKK